MPPKSQKPFSEQLAAWLKNNKNKTIASLSETFKEKSFAVAFLLLMSFAALPIPTGGITHVFEVITMLLALELIAGRRTIWLPKKMRKYKLNNFAQHKVLPFLAKRIAWFERFARPRLGKLLSMRFYRSLIGILVLCLTIVAFLVPPFSGLDTLPAMGVVIISLSIIFEDFAMFIFGSFVGLIGIAIVISIGSIVTKFVSNIF